MMSPLALAWWMQRIWFLMRLIFVALWLHMPQVNIAFSKWQQAWSISRVLSSRPSLNPRRSRLHSLQWTTVSSIRFLSNSWQNCDNSVFETLKLKPLYPKKTKSKFSYRGIINFFRFAFAKLINRLAGRSVSFPKTTSKHVQNFLMVIAG